MRSFFINSDPAPHLFLPVTIDIRLCPNDFLLYNDGFTAGTKKNNIHLRKRLPGIKKLNVYIF
ncbi:hypothetical protein C7S20_07395 [Christiangramia fulva]|uniref:Uncharacterized protein n=1 Tax=Christiangramia fulva TaxID=2126553 RepID=A0A2R3Z4E9_9FLAO|nr:hypothetical protein [Christiangramia fulva]AVR45108.1 hypothetical protein C7S20_07395 [Christiangramia fulva]